MPMIKSTKPCSNGLKGVLIKEKALYFAKEFFFKNFQASDGSLDKWKKRLGLSLQQFRKSFFENIDEYFFCCK